MFPVNREKVEVEQIYQKLNISDGEEKQQASSGKKTEAGRPRSSPNQAKSKAQSSKSSVAAGKANNAQNARNIDSDAADNNDCAAELLREIQRNAAGKKAGLTVKDIESIARKLLEAKGISTHPEGEIKNPAHLNQRHPTNQKHNKMHNNPRHGSFDLRNEETLNKKLDQRVQMAHVNKKINNYY